MAEANTPIAPQPAAAPVPKPAAPVTQPVTSVAPKPATTVSTASKPAAPLGGFAFPAGDIPSEIPLENSQILSPMEAFQKALSQEAVGAKAGKKGAAEGGGSNVIEFVDNALENAITMKVSDIHFETFQDYSRLRYRLDGTLQEVTEFKEFLYDHYSAIITRIKIMSQLDISERRLPQDGAIQFDMKSGERVDIRVSILPTANGERVVMRIMDKGSLNTPLDKLGFPEQQLNQVKKAIHSPQGLILVTGPTGSGKSTTLYAVLNSMNTPDLNILTAEDPVEFNVNGIGQVFVKEAIGLTFPAALKSFLRQDPEVIMVGEIRDKETGDIAVKAALTGHLVLSTLHTNNAPSTITRLINMGIPPYLLTSSLSLVVAQRLGKVICKHCIDDDQDGTPEALKAIGFTEEEAQTVKPKIGKGCDACMNNGTKGRCAIHEVLTISKIVKEAIYKNCSDMEIAEIAKQKDNFKTMQDRGRQLIAEGRISMEEFRRVLVSDDD